MRKCSPSKLNGTVTEWLSPISILSLFLVKVKIFVFPLVSLQILIPTLIHTNCTEVIYGLEWITNVTSKHHYMICGLRPPIQVRKKVAKAPANSISHEQFLPYSFQPISHLLSFTPLSLSSPLNYSWAFRCYLAGLSPDSGGNWSMCKIIMIVILG